MLTRGHRCDTDAVAGGVTGAWRGRWGGDGGAGNARRLGSWTPRMDMRNNRVAEAPNAQRSTTVSTPDSSPSPQPGERYLGTVVKLAAFGAFVSLPSGHTGLLHIDELRRASGRRKLKDPGEVVGIGQQLQVEVNLVDNRGKVTLTLVAGPGQ